jgi:benzylsuccinate CoA-transferase BbsF subunit
MAALTGLQHLTGLPGREPIGTGTNYPDHIPNPCHAAFAVLAALHYRRKTGFGQYIDMAQTEPTIALLGPALLDVTVNGHDPQAAGNDEPGAAPHGAYPCQGADRWITICVMNEAQWQGLVEAIGAPEWARAEKWMHASARWEDRRQIDDRLAEETRRFAAADLMRALQRRRVPAGLVQDAEDIVSRDPQLTHRGHWLRLNHPEMGETIYNAAPFRLSRSAATDPKPAPLLGEHTDEVLRDVLGLSNAEIADLKADGALD